MSNLTDLLAGPDVRVDSRARLRDRRSPATVTTVRLEESLADALGRATTADPVPSAIVVSDGTIYVMSAGGSGVIWSLGSETPASRSAIDRISNALTDLGASASPKPAGETTKMTSPKKKASSSPPAKPKVEEPGERILDGSPIESEEPSSESILEDTKSLFGEDDE